MVNSDGNGVVLNDELRRVILELSVGDKVGIWRVVNCCQIWVALQPLRILLPRAASIGRS